MAIIIITVGDAKCIRDRVRAGSVGRLSWAKNVIHCEIVNLLTRRTKAAHIVGMQITYTVDHHHHLRRVPGQYLEEQWCNNNHPSWDGQVGGSGGGLGLRNGLF